MASIKIITMLLGLLLIACNAVSNQDRSVRDYLACRSYINSNFADYSEIYNMMTDSLYMYIARKQKYSFHPRDTFQVDSLFLFNEERNRFITTINVIRTSMKSSRVDIVIYAYGVKLDSNWYFRRFGNVPVRRDSYHEELRRPLSFEILSYISRTSRLDKAYSVDRNGKLIPDYNYLKERLSGKTLMSLKDDTPEKFKKEALRRYSRFINNLMDSTEIAETFFSVDTSVIPVEPPVTEERRERIERYQNIFSEIGINY